MIRFTRLRGVGLRFRACSKGIQSAPVADRLNRRPQRFQHVVEVAADGAPQLVIARLEAVDFEPGRLQQEINSCELWVKVFLVEGHPDCSFLLMGKGKFISGPSGPWVLY